MVLIIVEKPGEGKEHNINPSEEVKIYPAFHSDGITLLQPGQYICEFQYFFPEFSSWKTVPKNDAMFWERTYKHKIRFINTLPVYWDKYDEQFKNLHAAIHQIVSTYGWKDFFFAAKEYNKKITKSQYVNL